MNEQILSLGQSCLRIVSSQIDTASFLGGKPKVTRTIEWPQKDGKALAFIAQLDLTEINQNQVLEWLPDTGRLLFFYDIEEEPWGFDPADSGGWAIIHDNGSGELQTQDLPSNLPDEHYLATTKFVKSEKFISYPDVQRISLEELGLSEDDEDDYFLFIDGLYGNEARHQMGGYPTPEQNDTMEEECQLVSGGVYYGNSARYHSKKATELRKQPNDWRLVLQYDSDDDVEVMWGDMGILYFWVRESEARKCNFSNAWMVLPCG